MPRSIHFTEEEKKEDIKDVEEMLRENPNCHEIARVLGRSVSYICDIRDYLDRENILTTEELEQIALEKIDEKNREFDKKVLYLKKAKKSKHQIQIALKAGNRKVDKSLERLSQIIDLSKYQTEEEFIEQERLKKIENFVNNGVGTKYIAEIAKVTDIPAKTTERLVQKLINDGRIKQENIINKREEEQESVTKRNEEIYALSKDKNVPIPLIAEKFGLFPDSVRRIIKKRGQQKSQENNKPKEKKEVKEPDDSLTLQEKSILEYLKEGIFYHYICKKENLEQNDLMKIIASLKERNYINQEIINTAKEERRNYYLDTIEQFLEDGLKPPIIYKRINGAFEELSLKTIYKFINILIDAKKITKEEIEKAQEENEFSFASIDRRLIPLIKKGYSIKEMADLEENLSEGQVRESRKRVITSENITKEQLEKWRKKREQKKKNEIYRKDERLIWSYVEKEGLDDKVIAILIDASKSYVKKRRLFYQQSHGISTKEYILIKFQGRLKRQKKEENQRKIIESFYKVKELYQIQYKNSLPRLSTKRSYFRLFVKIADLGIYKFTKEDIDLLAFTILYEEEFLTDENIKYVIEQYLSRGEEEEAIRFLNTYINYDEVVKNLEFTKNLQSLVKNYQVKKAN